jgi:hypothetical protein
MRVGAGHARDGILGRRHGLLLLNEIDIQITRYYQSQIEAELS